MRSQLIIPGIMCVLIFSVTPSAAAAQDLETDAGVAADDEPEEAEVAESEPEEPPPPAEITEVEQEDQKAEVSVSEAVQPSVEKNNNKKEEEGDEKPVIKISARIHAGWEMGHESSPEVTYNTAGTGTASAASEGSDYSNAFIVRRARLKLRWTPNDWLLGVIQVDGAELFETGGSILRDAYLHFTVARQLELRIGQFKKPFSGLELRSPAKRRLINRGPGNDELIEDLRYGDRDIGLQVSGRLIKSIKLDYAIGVFNGNGMNAVDWEDNFKDLVGRLRIRPHKRLVIGANGSFKFFETPVANQPSNSWAAGGDMRVQLGKVRLYGEGLVGENWLVGANTDGISADNPPMVINALGVLSYKHEFPVSWGFAVEPAFKFEFLDPDSEITDDAVLVYTPGLNTYFGKYFRLMINGEITRASSNSLGYQDKEILTVLACLDI